jgi:Fic family protein
MLRGYGGWFLDCLERAIVAAEETLATVTGKARFWESYVAVAFNDRQKMLVTRLLEGFEGKLTTSKWAKLAKCSQDTALRDILGLVDSGVLAKDPAGGRSTSYSLREF